MLVLVRYKYLSKNIIIVNNILKILLCGLRFNHLAPVITPLITSIVSKVIEPIEISAVYLFITCVSLTR